MIMKLQSIMVYVNTTEATMKGKCIAYVSIEKEKFPSQ